MLDTVCLISQSTESHHLQLLLLLMLGMVKTRWKPFMLWCQVERLLWIYLVPSMLLIEREGEGAFNDTIFHLSMNKVSLETSNVTPRSTIKQLVRSIS